MAIPVRDIMLSVRDRLVSTEDTVCLERARLATEAWELFDGLPMPIKRAQTFAFILDRMPLDLESNPVFAGNTSTRPRA